MVIEVSDDLIIEISDLVAQCANANGFNGPAFYMLAQEVAGTGKLAGDITLAEFAELYKKARERYNAMEKRLSNLRGA
jgi:hypothetical protein